MGILIIVMIEIMINYVSIATKMRIQLILLINKYDSYFVLLKQA